MRLRLCDDLEEGERIWKTLLPARHIFDCWQVRMSFQQSFKRPSLFLVAEANRRYVGLLALSWIEEEKVYACFPGETWRGTTWLERNQIPAMSHNVQRILWEAAPNNTVLRYVVGNVASSLGCLTVDEVNYSFTPSHFAYDYNAYWMLFSRKSRKSLEREAAKIINMGCEYLFNRWDDIDWMFQMNLETFTDKSYFYDPRFLNGFTSMLSFFADSKTLRVTTLKVKGTIAAVDVGVIYNNQYTLLAGATNPSFPGIAKVINLFHLKWACSQHLEYVDFLCGDFGWKTRFHLTPCPLYLMEKGSSVISAESVRTNFVTV